MQITTVVMNLTPDQVTALYDALILRAEQLETNVPGSDRSVAINSVAACLVDQMGYPVPAWLTE